MEHDRNKGISVIEILVVMAILTVLSVIALSSFTASKKKKELQAISNDIIFKLEQMKTNAIAGKQGQSYGVKFNTGSYVSFMGSSYISTNLNNQTFPIASGFQITNTIPGTDDAVVFTRLTGSTGITATVTVSQVSSSANKKDIVIGPLGDIGIY